jgi:signal transduction histidine kinase
MSMNEPQWRTAGVPEPDREGGDGTHHRGEQGGGYATPYTRQRMDSGRVGEMAGGRLDEAYAEAGQAVSYVANQLRVITERYRERYGATLAVRRREFEREGIGDVAAASTDPDDPTIGDVGRRQLELAKLELAVTHLERTWLFLQHGDATLAPEPGAPDLPTDLQMQIVEAQEAERQRLAQEVHDGPAQALTNAIFQVEYIDRVLDRDAAGARTEIRYLRDLLRRELADVRTFITQLRPPLLDEIGLYGAIRDQATTLSSATGAAVDLDLDAPPERLGDAQQTVILRIVQEALQNIRRHAQASRVRIVTHAGADPAGDWIIEIRDDGRGFEPAQLSAQRGARSFGLRFMRERANLIGARLDIEARPGAGTSIRVTLPGGTKRR